MRPYDPNLPLVFIHVPKTAGTSVREVFSGWFGERLVQHYFNFQQGRPPGRSPRFDQHTADKPVCIYGHFNRERGFGIRDAYPDAKQFITILREPFDHACSTYFYRRKQGHENGIFGHAPTTDLPTFLDTEPSTIFRHFPCDVSAETYREVIDTLFIEVGITENLPVSLTRIAAALGRTFDPACLGRLNVTDRDTGSLDLAALRDRYRARFPLQHAVYDYVRARYESC
jgi:hypothetical protein